MHGNYEEKELLSFKEFTEDLSIAQRFKASRALKRRKALMKMAKKRSLRRTAGKETLQRRARKQARAEIFRKLSKGKSASQLPIVKRMAIQKRLKRLNKRISILTRRKIPIARRMDARRKIGGK